MKKRTAFFGAILSLMPIGQPFLVKGGVSLVTSAIIFHNKKINAESAEFYNNRGIDKLDAEDYEGAISDFTEAIKINPKHKYAYYNRGIAKEDLEDYKGAISDYTEAIKINPWYADAYNNRGNAKLNLEDYKGAISDFTEAIKINPKHEFAYSNRGIAKENLEDYKGAISDYTEAIKINPKDGYSYLDRSFNKVSIGDIKGAVFDKNKGLEIFEKNIRNKVKLSTKDILYTDVSSDPLFRGFNKYAGFDGNTYTRPITYYLHDKNGKLNSKLLPKHFKKTYEHSLDEEKFIVNFISKIDKYIDLDFKRVYSKTDAMIRIYKTNIHEDNYGAAYDNGDNVPDKWFRLDVAWGDPPMDIPKLKKYPTLSVDSAYTIVHELGHALGLAHFDEGCGKYCKSNFDPEDMRINSKKTVMSYNNFLYPVDDMFVTEFDLKALRKVWGVEKGN
ncbi:tetratricopeptide repeat protein [Prochlorococcus marinus]|uniref:tetratricopeptide repeat protein n=1 Tax=Prochlorococcus marinus TaxID=1219 RepID=UPI001ADA4FB1|nr:tetratricopeptide repeat protein [Prochlorococcus marinus]MBO8203586.1 tetratricopeptide repeat protein [Prochlorococcus marinus CUG1415]MBW3044746.1 hypothetical protein [Prochlorococcus marinus str. MU1415]